MLLLINIFKRKVTPNGFSTEIRKKIYFEKKFHGTTVTPNDLLQEKILQETFPQNNRSFTTNSPKKSYSVKLFPTNFP